MQNCSTDIYKGYRNDVANWENDYKTTSGERIIITLKDSNNATLLENDFLTIVNELKSEGAKAISINEQRIKNAMVIISIKK